MARGADGPAFGPDPENGPEHGDNAIGPNGRPRLKGLLRGVEGVLFCCLSAVTILWIADRSRDLDFDPIPVSICTAETCRPPTFPDPWARYTAAQEMPGVQTYAAHNHCRMAVTLLEQEATDPATTRVIADLEARGTIAVTRAVGGGAGLVAPGRHNDGWGDVLRDALRWGPGRGCHPGHYAPVIRPLIVVWLVVLALRLFRNRQEVWSRR